MKYDLKESFLNAAYELPKEVSRKIWKTVLLVSRNPDSPGLNFEKLHGKADGLWSIRVDQKYRVILLRSPELMTLLFVGPEEDAYQFAERASRQIFLRTERYSIPFPVRKSSRDDSSSKDRKSIPNVQLSPTGKYLPLARHLLNAISKRQTVTLSFQEVENILQTSLPPSARKHRPWWANDLTHVQAVAWLSVGWQVSNVDIQDEVVTFDAEQELTIV